MLWVPCAPHCMDLLLEDMGKMPWAKETIEPVRDLVTFIRNHQGALAIFSSISERARDTCFGTVYLMCERMLLVKQALKQLWVHNDMEKWRKKNKKAGAEYTRLQDVLINSPRAWRRVEDLVALSTPIMVLLRLADSSAATMGKIYYRCVELKRHLETVNLYSTTTAQRREVLRVFQERWDMLHSPLHSAGAPQGPHGSSVVSLSSVANVR
ncbi:hypothetical protein CHLRE_04g217966v5 [Chlamydomonas reinhardtii]|uniref:DUF659 domain-containing protein n=1 Tax=Chlamydomonas reinhardtii TaxID=3055 RepID=A0A2K3DTK8_CHLRE|nr:uncharacterized protein CHLRE_04g217966v5 [Chlamydomonas reinhardtii]PNW83868.1 hypothetical protein CHLRE_04g217966v5 [Chlamydomonas reinhardtii]